MTRHDPNFLVARGRYWAECTCGWRSGYFAGQVGSHLMFARHLTDTERATA